MKLKISWTGILLSLILILVSKSINAQDSTVSLAFKRNRFPTPYPLFYTPDLAYQIKQQFQLTKMANSGDPLAQHELGLRYLQGLDVPSDTIKAAEWIGKAAAQDLPAACYNYGILLINGWGTRWNPFEAYINFKKAAEAGMAQAQFITGLLYLENLVVRKDLMAAASWLKKSAAQNFEPAVQMLQELGVSKENDSTATIKAPKAPIDNSSPLVFIDFTMDSSALKELTENDLIQALQFTGNEELTDSIIAPDSTYRIRSNDLPIIEQTAEAGSPEALVLLGYLYENGKFVQKDIIKAGIYYYRAAKLDSRNGAYLLWKLNNSSQLYRYLEKYVKDEEPEAMFLLYGLKSFNLTDMISESAARDLLFKAAAAGLEEAVIESAINISSGKDRFYEKEKGMEILRDEALKGNLFAEVRYISIKIIDSSKVSQNDIERLFFASNKGSIIAETLLGYCYLQGLQVPKDYGISVKYFRRAAQRGSTFAFSQLQQLHNKFRPPDEIFSVSE